MARNTESDISRIEAKYDINDSFGVTLARYRNLRGYSQQELAELSGFDRATIFRLENGERHPKRKTIACLALVLELDNYQTDSLLKSAGFRGDNETEAIDLTDEPEIEDMLRVLKDENVPDKTKESMRQALKIITEMGRAATGSKLSLLQDEDSASN